jgi:hypothetical protein
MSRPSKQPHSGLIPSPGKIPHLVGAAATSRSARQRPYWPRARIHPGLYVIHDGHCSLCRRSERPDGSSNARHANGYTQPGSAADPGFSERSGRYPQGYPQDLTRELLQPQGY